MTRDADPSLVEQWLAAGDRGELHRFDEFLDPDVVVHAPAGLSTHGVDAETAVADLLPLVRDAPEHREGEE